MKTIHAADLFCGAGGTSQGFINACKKRGYEPKLLAINHWPRAIATHTLNHPGVQHLCETLDSIDPRVVIPERHLDILCASPECTHHSLAAGGRPKNEQSRATAWHVLRWAEAMRVENILVENVKEFMSWGPLGKNNKPLKRQRGRTFKAFINALESIGYNVEYRILTSADYGDPTTRERLFILGRRNGKVVWPAPSHGQPGQLGVPPSGGLPPWRAAREIIDWDLKGASIFNRKKPLCQNTLRRINAGLRKFGGANAEPFLVILYGMSNVRDIKCPAPTLTGHSHLYLCEPFIVHATHGEGEERRTHSIDNPLPTVTSAKDMALCEPFLTHITHTGAPRSHSIDNPLPTVTGAHRGEMALIEPFITRYNGSHAGQDGDQRNSPVDQPLPTQDTSNRYALVEPMIMGQQSCAAARPVSEPIPTVAAAGAIALVEPFLVKFYGTAEAADLKQPLDTVTARDRFMLVEPKTGRAIAELDILFRMLQPHELAAAQGFPKDY